MRRWIVVVVTLLCITALNTLSGPAHARGIFFFMGDQTGDNIFQLEVVIDDSKYRHNKFEMVQYSRGVSLKLVEDNSPPLIPCEGLRTVRGSGNAGRLVFGGQDDITEANIEISDIDRDFFDTHTLEFYWLDLCQRSAWIMVVPKE